MNLSLARAGRRIASLVGFAFSSAPSIESGNAQVLQLTHMGTGEVHDATVSIQLFGFASAPMVGCHHLAVYGEGDRSKGFVIASNDPRFRPKTMVAGESQMHDASGQFIYQQGGLKIIVNAVSEIDLQIGGTLVGKITAGGLAITGSITATGEITRGFGTGDQASLGHHSHLYIPGSGTPTQTSPPTAGT